MNDKVEETKHEAGKEIACMNSGELRMIAINGLAPFLAEFFAVLNDKEDGFGCKSNYVLEQALEMTKDIIKSAGDLQEIEAKNTSDVLKLLGTGKITISECQNLMSIMHTKSEIDDAKDVISKLDELLAK